MKAEVLMIASRVALRLDDNTVCEDVIKEMTQTVIDRLLIRLGTCKLPEPFYSVAVDATVKAIRRIHYEGITSEGSANISTSFVSDILEEYKAEIEQFRHDNMGKTLKFF